MILYLVNLHMLQKYCIIILVSSEMIVELTEHYYE